jgi:predicted CXXCH cytochrome family protein
MRANRRYWPHLLAVLLLVGLGGLTATLVAATKESSDKVANDMPKVVAPPDRAVLLSGNLDVIYQGDKAELEVDSRAVPWEEFYDGVIRVGHVHLTPGMHRVKIGDRKVQLCVALNEMEHDGPSDWKIFRAHTISAEKDRCAECHDAETREGRMVVGKASIPDSCTACHTDTEVTDTHQEIVKPLKSCDTCHVMHGSPYEHLLKAPEVEIRKKYGIEKK